MTVEDSETVLDVVCLIAAFLIVVGVGVFFSDVLRVVIKLFNKKPPS